MGPSIYKDPSWISPAEVTENIIAVKRYEDLMGYVKKNFEVVIESEGKQQVIDINISMMQVREDVFNEYSDWHFHL